MVMPLPAYAPSSTSPQITGRERVDLRARPRRRAGRARPRPAGRAVRRRRPHPAADPAAQPVGPGLHPRRARGRPRRRRAPRRPGDHRRDPRAAGAARAPSTCRTCPSRAPPTTRSPSWRRRRRSTPPGLRCAQIIAPDDATRERLLDAPMARQRLVVAARRRRRAWRRTPTATRGWPHCVERLDQQRGCSAACSPSTCPRPGCGRWRRRTSPGSTCARTATPTRRRSALRAGAGAAGAGARLPARARRATSGSTSRRRPSGSTEIIRRLANALETGERCAS